MVGAYAYKWHSYTSKILIFFTLVGAVHKEEKEPDPLLTISNLLLLTTKGNKPTSRKDKRLIIIVLYSFRKLSFHRKRNKICIYRYKVVSNECSVRKKWYKYLTSISIEGAT